jgi:ankyrin repeat protein
LLAAGADVNAKTKGGGTALMMAEKYGLTEIVQLLKQAGAKE